ncbi:MAG: peptidylprolyl isomerase [Calditrichaceae bacterium]|nr:peptidylprolyl isomerase [Calditrichia bacterium]NUQ43030.1 peptidylprolyl isomerase [Calditrichaceae bacterium]
MPFKLDQVVTVHLSIADETGEVLESTFGSEPLAFLSGRQQILPRLEERIATMPIHGKSTLTLSPEEAFGAYDESAVRIAKRSSFPEGAPLEEGMDFVAVNESGEEMPFMITKVEGDDITIDFNHPYAGKTLTIDVELIGMREATPEELDHGHVHGAGGHHH